MALDTVTRPRRAAGRARRRGNDVTEAISDATEDVVDEVSALPERVMVAYVRLLRRRARRDDVVGTVSRGVLDALHRPAKDWARFFQRLERETTVEVGRRGGARRTTRRTASTTSTRGSVRGTARTAARKATSGARRTAKTARGTAPRTARGTRRRTG